MSFNMVHMCTCIPTHAKKYVCACIHNYAIGIKQPNIIHALNDPQVEYLQRCPR